MPQFFNGFKNKLKKYDINKGKSHNNKFTINKKVLTLPNIEWVKKEHEYDLIPKNLGWSMKFIGKTGSKKTTFIVSFVEFFVNHCNSVFEILVISPTFNQNTWDRIRKIFIFYQRY